MSSSATSSSSAVASVTILNVEPGASVSYTHLDVYKRQAVAAWTERIQTFEREHAQAWLPAFMQRTQELAAEKPYCAFAALALTVMEVRS